MSDSMPTPYGDSQRGGDANFLADLSDDDGAVLDSFVSSEADPPTPDELPIVKLMLRPLASDIPARKSIRTRTINMAENVPYMLAPASPWRERVVIRMNKTATLLLANNRTAVQDTITAARFGGNSSGEFVINSNDEIWGLSQLTGDTLVVGILEEITEKVGR